METMKHETTSENTSPAMKRNDIILIAAIIFIAVSGLIALFFMRQNEGNLAVVSYKDTEILHINLANGTHRVLDESYIYRPSNQETNPLFEKCFIESNIYCVKGELGVVVIEYDTHRVRVIEETSPQNICRIQGFTNSPMQSLICLPNYIVITVRDGDADDNDFFS